LTDYRLAFRLLNEDLFGLAEQKMDLITELRMNDSVIDGNRKIICFVGPRGAGKRSLAATLARALGQKFLTIRIGQDDDCGAPRYGRSKAGELAGNLLHLMDRNRGQRLLILLDGIEYINPIFQNRTVTSFREVLTISHEHSLRLGHIDQPLNFADVVFVATAREARGITREMLDELKLIQFTGYCDDEKVEIVKRWMIQPNHSSNACCGAAQIDDDGIFDLIRCYTNELGVFELRAVFDRLQRQLVFESTVAGAAPQQRLGRQDLSRYLGPPLYDAASVRNGLQVGAVAMLGRCDGRGVISEIEVLTIPDPRANLVLTGNLDALFREVVMVALSCLRKRSAEYGISPEFLSRHTVHVNAIPGGVLKSGVSSGLAVLLALFSEIKGLPLRADLSAIGEVTLRGGIRRVIGVPEKILGAHRLGIRTLCYPNENQGDIDRLPRELVGGLELIGVDSVDQALMAVFGDKFHSPTAPRARS
jgi:ATP-dependent Lon protease